MTNKSLRLDQPSSRRLLARILDDPSLVATVQALEPRTLGKLINHVGLEDSGEIVSLATTEQIKQIFDDDLWKSDRPGKDESFDADRFALWLEVMFEAGEDFVAEKLIDFPEDVVTLALHRHILVVNIDELKGDMDEHDDHGELVDKALESCLYQEFGEYQVISRRHEGWDSIVATLAALDKHDHALLERILDRCCYMSSEFIEENGGLYDVLTSDEMLETDLAADREDRRAGEGFIAPSQAASFLALCRATSTTDVLAQPRDAVTRAYFRELVTPASKASASPVRALPVGAADRLGDLEHMLASLDIEGPPRGARPMFLLEARDDIRTTSALFKTALAELHAEDPALHAQRMEELAYLCNVLVAGCPVDGRVFRPFEAVVAVAAVCNLGMEQLVKAARGTAPSAILAREGADKAFRVGWRTLHVEVAMATCEGLTSAFTLRAQRTRDAGDRRAFEYSAKFVKEKHAQQKPWLARNRVRDLRVDPEIEAMLYGLLGDCPLLVGALVRPGADRHELDRGRQFVSAEADLKRIRAFLVKL